MMLGRLAVYPLIDHMGGIRKGTSPRCVVRIWLVGIETGRVEGLVDILSYVEIRGFSNVKHGLEYNIFCPDSLKVVLIDSGLEVHEMTADRIWGQIRDLVNGPAYGWQARGGLWDVTSHTCEHCSFSTYGNPDCSLPRLGTIFTLYCSNPYGGPWGAPVKLDHSCEHWAPKDDQSCVDGR